MKKTGNIARKLEIHNVDNYNNQLVGQEHGHSIDMDLCAGK